MRVGKDEITCPEQVFAYFVQSSYKHTVEFNVINSCNETVDDQKDPTCSTCIYGQAIAHKVGGLFPIKYA